MWPFDWFRRKRDAALGLAAQPVDINPSGNAREDRRRGRIKRLRQAIKQGDKRREVRDELERLERGD